MSYPIVLIAAVAANGIIGADNALPFRLSSDLKRFKALTLHRPIIMGRKTFDSIGRPLPGRPNIVITRSATWSHEGAHVVASLKAAIELATTFLGDMADRSAQEIMIIGGGQIYAEAFGHADRLLITHVDAAPEGDTSFPKIDLDYWQALSEEHVPIGDKDNCASRFVVYERKKPSN